MLNKILIMGRLTRDPELKQTQTNVPVCRITVACERDFARPGEERQTDFLDVDCWRKDAEFVSKYFRKGSMIIVEGRLQTSKWQDQQGNNRVFYTILAEHCRFGETKRDSSPATGSYNSTYTQAPPMAPAPQAPAYNSGYGAPQAPVNPQPAPASAAPSAGSSPYSESYGDEELPF